MKKMEEHNRCPQAASLCCQSKRLLSWRGLLRGWAESRIISPLELGHPQI